MNKPSMSQYRPILVNERKEIIDGQHRFEALKSLNLPVYYVIGEGLSIDDARVLNIDQRNWTPMDYAESYATSGDESYQIYLDTRKQYGLSHNVTIAYLANSLSTHQTELFRQGGFKVNNPKLSEVKLARLLDLSTLAPDHWKRKQFGLAFLSMMQIPEYNHKHFCHKLGKYGDRFLAKFEIMQDYQRAFEKTYNFHTQPEKQIKTF